MTNPGSKTLDNAFYQAALTIEDADAYEAAQEIFLTCKAFNEPSRLREALLGSSNSLPELIGREKSVVREMSNLAVIRKLRN